MPSDFTQRAERIATLYFKPGTPEHKYLVQIITKELELVEMETMRKAEK